MKKPGTVCIWSGKIIGLCIKELSQDREIISPNYSQIYMTFNGYSRVYPTALKFKSL